MSDENADGAAGPGAGDAASTGAGTGAAAGAGEEGAPARPGQRESRRRMAERHDDERKELKNRVKAMGKKSKAAKKEAQKQGQLWQQEMKERHEAEMALAASDTEESGGDDSADGDSDGGGASDDSAEERRAAVAAAQAEAEAKAAAEAAKAAKAAEKKRQKAARKRERKLAEEAARDKRVEDARATAVDERQLEMDAIQAVLDTLSPPLTMQPVPADGNCMFHAVGDQLKRLRDPLAETEPKTLHRTLRRMTADHIEAHADDFAGFLVFDAEDTAAGAGAGGGDADGSAALHSYCARLRDTAAWGGEPELRALAAAIGRPFTVYRAGRDALRVGDADPGPDADATSEGHVLLSFHERYYALGDHYNSVVPKAKARAR